MRKRVDKKVLLQIIIVVLVFWILDYLFHNLGVGESRFYYISKLANALLFSVIWFFVFNSESHIKKLIFSFVFGTWISFYYLVSAYSGLVQFLGIYANYSPPPFVIGDLYLSPILWWFFHIFSFYLGLEVARLIKE